MKELEDKIDVQIKDAEPTMEAEVTPPGGAE